MKTMKKLPRLTNNEDKGEETLDANLWSQLQEHIPLQIIYKKMSQQDLLRLRLVNKEWNHAALQWILPRSSFVTITPSIRAVSRANLLRNGIVTYNSAFGKFKFGHQHLHLHLTWTHVPPFEVEGLILCPNPDDLKERGVFNVHTRTWHTIPTGPNQSEAMFACGLLVDITPKPYTFKLVEGHLNFKTQIYDSKSNSWSITSSQLPSSVTKSRLFTFEYCCICHNNNIYMSINTHMILKYSLEDDKWTELKSPKGWNLNNCPTDCTTGVWANKIFTTTTNKEEERVTVWELVDSEKQEWVEYACMPKEQYKWLWKRNFDGFHRYRPHLRSFFRDGYMLVCSWRWITPKAEMLVLFDLATKTWQNVDLPTGIVEFDEQKALKLS